MGEPVDWDRARKGLAPWSSDGYMDVLDFHQKLDTTPKDDWDLRRYRVAFEITEGDVQAFEINPLMPENQVGLFIRKRYAMEGMTTVAAHMVRYWEMNWFFDKHRTRFAREGFIRKSDEAGKIEINDCLFKALAEAPFVRRRRKAKGKGCIRPSISTASSVAHGS